LASIVYAAFAYKQLETMRGQLDEMRTEQRPWVNFDSFGAPPGVENIGLAAINNETMTFYINYSLKLENCQLL
jgi:hypothetical protein